MRFKNKCPGKMLGELVAAFNYVFYPHLMETEEDFRERIEKVAEIDDKEIKHAYKDYTKTYHKRRAMADTFIASGKHEEIFEDLRVHVNSCSNCLTRYIHILEEAIKFERDFGYYIDKIPSAKEIGQEGLEAYFLGLIKKEDSELLKLLE
jgi:hypothetical protein